MAPIKFGVGQSVLRKEDDALIRGRGRYTDDHAPSAAMHALVLRSPHAHAKFTINVTRARGLPGVATILTAEDVKDLGGLPCLFNLEVNPFTGPPYAILAHGEVRHVGDAVAFVVAETIDQARDRVPGHPELACLHGGAVVGQHRGGRPVHPAEVPGVGGAHDLPDGPLHGPVGLGDGRGVRLRLHHQVQRTEPGHRDGVGQVLSQICFFERLGVCKSLNCR